MDRQKDLAERLRIYIKSHGIKQKFVSERIDLCPTLLSHWLNNKKQLWDTSLDTIEQWLIEHEHQVN